MLSPKEAVFAGLLGGNTVRLIPEAAPLAPGKYHLTVSTLLVGQATLGTDVAVAP